MIIFRFSANVEPSNGLVGNSSDSSKLDSSVTLSAVNKWSSIGVRCTIEQIAVIMSTS